MRQVLWWFGMLAAASAHAGECSKLEVTDAWAKLAPPGAKVMAGYARLSNWGEAVVVVAGVSSDEFESVELHSMTMDDGVMRMRKLDDVSIDPGQTLVLAPGGKHLMLIGPKQEFVAGDLIEVDLDVCSGAAQQRAQLDVRAD